MPQIAKTTTITLDNNSYEVASMSDEAKSLVTYIDEWRQKEMDLSGELLLVRAALRDIQTTLAENIKLQQTQP